MKKLTFPDFENKMFIVNLLYLPLVIISKSLYDISLLIPVTFVNIIYALALIEKYIALKQEQEKPIGDIVKGQWDK